MHSKAPTNIIDEAFTVREEMIKYNARSISSLYRFDLEKDLCQTMITRSQNFSKTTWSPFYVTYLHNPFILIKRLYKPTTTLDNDKRVLGPLHFEKKA
ncbi:hypothetical protein G9A89_021734 [Geosiphon pyriformis]|nr:hypothetical protein G9A89_021734 [Geosiphon pyriformis]